MTRIDVIYKKRQIHNTTSIMAELRESHKKFNEKSQYETKVNLTTQKVIIAYYENKEKMEISSREIQWSWSFTSSGSNSLNESHCFLKKYETSLNIIQM